MNRIIAALLCAALLAPGPAFAQAVRFQAPMAAPCAFLAPVSAPLPALGPAAALPSLAEPSQGLSPLQAAPEPEPLAAPARAQAAEGPQERGAAASGESAEGLGRVSESLGRSAAAPAAALDSAFDGISMKAAVSLESPETAALPSVAAARPRKVSLRAKVSKALLGASSILYSGIALARPDGYDYSTAYGDPAPGPIPMWAVPAIIIGVPLMAAMTYGAVKLFDYLRSEQKKQEQAASAPSGEPEAKAKDLNGKKVTFDDIAGQEEAKADFMQVLDYLRNPEKYQKKNGKGFKGIILYGPPGTGKTQLARALANEAGVHFEAMAGSEFVEKYVGVGASRVRDAFSRIRTQGKGKGILFIDEFDALGRKRKDNGDGNEEYEQTLNQVLKEMDGFDKDPVIVIAATNRLDSIDPALLRGRRFGLKVSVGLPDVKGREAIFRVHTQVQRENGQLADDVDFKELARDTPGLAGADIEEIVNSASMAAAYRNAEKIEMVDFRRALERQTIGNEIRRVIPMKERQIVAYHESGHALVSHLLPNGDPVRKVTIVPNGNGAAGYMQSASEEERMMHSRAWLTDRMAVALGGRAAELMMTGDSYTGASNDLEVTKNIARQMVMKWGMSDRIGMIAYDHDGERPTAGKALSERTKRMIDLEVKALVDEAYAKAVKVLTEHKAALEAMSKELLDKETLRGEDVDRIVAVYPGAKS